MENYLKACEEFAEKTLGYFNEFLWLGFGMKHTLILITLK